MKHKSASDAKVWNLKAEVRYSGNLNRKQKIKLKLKQISEEAYKTFLTWKWMCRMYQNDLNLRTFTALNFNLKTNKS